MKLALNLAIGALTVVLIVTLALSVVYVTRINHDMDVPGPGQWENGKPPEYHFVVIADNLTNDFGRAFLEGVDEACKDFNAVAEIQGLSEEGAADELLARLDAAVVSGVDGIITQAADREEYVRYIDKAVDSGVPVITVIRDCPKSRRQSFVGINPYELGKKAAELADVALDGEGRVAIILEESFEEASPASKTSTIELGFRDVIKNRGELGVVTVQKASSGLLDALDITRNIILEHPDVDLILCTSEKDTISAAQVLVDFNRTDVKLIGRGNSEQIRKYVEKGIVAASMLDNPGQIGYKSVKGLVELNEFSTTSSYVDTGITVQTPEGIIQ